MVDIMVLFGADRKDAEKQMGKVYLLEREIAAVWFNLDASYESMKATQYCFCLFFRSIGINTGLRVRRQFANYPNTQT